MAGWLHTEMCPAPGIEPEHGRPSQYLAMFSEASETVCGESTSGLSLHDFESTFITKLI